ncbi:MAG: cupin domain-containing protein [Candidatus Dormibacteraceae bacterium]
MPEFRQPSEADPEAHGDGWQVSVLADGRHIHGLAMVARRWTVQPGHRTPERSHPGPDERFLYVISGRGSALVGGEHLEVGPEDMIWLEPRDTFAFEAAEVPLHILDAASGSR